MFGFNRKNDVNSAAKYTNLTINEYKDQFFDGKDHALVDVRTPQEFQRGHVPGAINVPLDDLPQAASKIPQGKPVVVICASGNRSRAGSSHIVDAGYKDVYNIKGGTMAWMMQRLPIEA